MKITNQPRCEYHVFGRVLTIPPGTFEVFSKKILLESICDKVEKSLKELFSGILEDPRGFPWAVACTPDKSDESEYFSLSGMLGCNDTISGFQSNRLGKRGIMDAFHDDSPHPGTDVLELIRQTIADTPTVASLVDQMQENFRAEWGLVEAMIPAYMNALIDIKRYRLQNAEDAEENALRKRREMVARECEESLGHYSLGRKLSIGAGIAAGGILGGAAAKALPKVSTGLASMAASRAASRAEKDVTSWNISDDELSFFEDMNFDEWAERIQHIVLDHYAELKRVAMEILLNREVPGWGSIAAMEETATMLRDKVGECYDKDLCCDYMFARPYDVDMAVEIVSLYGTEASGFRELQLDFGTAWVQKCDEKVSELCVDAKPDDETDVQTRLHILTDTYLPGFYAGESEFADAKANRLREMLDKLDIQARTVGEMVCSTREAAAASREEQGKVDGLVSVGKKYPFTELEKLIASLQESSCSSEYYQWVMEGLRKHRSFMLTVAGVEYATWEEAQRAFDAKVEETEKKKVASFIFKVASLGKDNKQALATMYWPGSLNPDGLVSKIRNFTFVEDAKRVRERIVTAQMDPLKKAFSKMDSFMQDHVSAYGDARRKVVAKAQDISDVSKHKMQLAGITDEQPKGFKGKAVAALKNAINPIGAYKKQFAKMGVMTSAFMQVCAPKSEQVREDNDNTPHDDGA